MNRRLCLTLRAAGQDAEWMTGSLRCRTAGDVFMLMKGSDVVGTDLSRWYAGVTRAAQSHRAHCHPPPSRAFPRRHSFANCSDCDSARLDSVSRVLALREWSHVETAREFRCFVRSRTVVGASACQRHPLPPCLHKPACSPLRRRFPQA